MSNAETYNSLPEVSLADLHQGDVVMVYDLFTCILPFTERVVKEGLLGLYINCDGPEGEGVPGLERHFLNGQQGDDGKLIGVRLVSSVSAKE